MSVLGNRDQCLQGWLGSVVVYWPVGIVGEISNMFDIYIRPLTTLVTDPHFIHLATGMLVNLMACWLHFPTCRLMKQACLYHVSDLSQIW